MSGPLGNVPQQVSDLARSLARGEVSVQDAGDALTRLAEDVTSAGEAAERQIALMRDTANATQADLEQKLEEISLFRTIGDLGGSLLLSKDPFRAILEQLLLLSHAASASIFLLEEVSERLVFASAAGRVPMRETNRPSFALGEGIAGRVAQTGKPILIDDTDTHPEFQHRTDTVVPIRSLVSFPLLIEDRTMGVLNLSADTPGMFGEETMRVLHILASQVAKLIENARLLAQRKAYVAQIEESERRYRDLVEEVSDGFFVADASGRPLLVNSRFATMFGRSREEMLAATDWASYLSADTRDRVRAALADIRTGNQGIEKSLEFSVLRPDEREVPVHLHCRTVLHQGDLVWIGTLRDMTNQKALQRQLMQTEKLASMGTLIAGTTHELNNKLAPILGYAQLIQQMEAPADLLSRIAVIQESAEGAKKIIDALLGFSRDSEVKPEPVRIAESVGAVLGISEAALRRAGIEVVRHDDLDAPVIFVARQQIEQVMLNMINNGMHAMRDSATRTLEVWTAKDKDGIVVGFRDTGCGISPDHLTRIFDPFFTTKPVNEGTGLGLSLSYGLVRAHGGDIYVESKPGRGTTFRIQLPVGSPDTPSQTMEMSSAEAQPWPGKPSLLIVDDEAPMRDLLEDVFADICGTTTAENGRAALDALARGHFDLLLVDVRMPALDGMGFYSKLRLEHPQLADHVIFMTGDTYDPDTRRFLDESGRPFLSKPFNIDEVVATVRRELSPAP